MNMLNCPASLLSGVATVLLFVVAFTGCKSDSDSSTSAPTTITVTGKVITASQQPLANSPVVITGRPTTTTDANGVFTVTGVGVPYDVTVAVSATKLGITYRGLSRQDPTLVNFLSSAPSANSATISGTVSGGAGYPQPVLRTSSVLIKSTEGSFSQTPSSTTGAYSRIINWDGAGTITVSLHAMQWDINPSGMPVAFHGYGEKTGVSVTAGGTFAGQNIAMTAVSAQTISGSIIVPATLSLSGKTLNLQWPTIGTMILGGEGGTATTFTYAVPVVTGTTLSVIVAASSGGARGNVIKTGIAPGTSGIALTIPTPPALSLPVEAATGVSVTTPFSWTPVASTIYLMTLTGHADEPDYLVVTDSPTATIPDLNALGLGLPAGATYSWNVYAAGPFANINAAAGPSGYLQQGDALNAVSSSRTFTTAP